MTTTETETVIETEVIINLPAKLDSNEELPASQILYGKGGPTAFVSYLQEMARKEMEAVDATTESGRTTLKSAAYTLAKIKTKADDVGKEVIEDAQKLVKSVNADRRFIREGLEALQEVVRKPVTDWEEAEEKRVAGHEAALEYLNELITFNGPPDATELRKRMDAFKARPPRDWEEYFDRAEGLLFQVDKTLTEGLSRQEKYEAEQIELAELRQIKADRDAKIAKDAADAAAAEAEKKRQSDLAAAAEAARVAAEEKAERDRVATLAEFEARAVALEAARVQEAEAAKAAAAKAEHAQRDAEAAAERKLAAQKAQAEEAARQAQIEADRKQQKAIDDERARVERERIAKEADDKRRAADLEHRKKINGQAVAALMSELAYVEDEAKELIMAIVRGKIPNVSVQY